MDINNSSFQEVMVQLNTIQNMLAANKVVMTLQDVSNYTGLSLSYLYKLTMSGILPHSKPNGKQIFVSKSELDNWLLSNGRKTDDEIEVEAANYLTTKKTGVR